MFELTLHMLYNEDKLTCVRIRSVEVTDQHHEEDNDQWEGNNPESDDDAPMAGRRADDGIQRHAHKQAHEKTAEMR